MKKLILLASVATLTACADTAVEEEAPAEDVAMEAMAEEEAGTAPDGGTTAGTYSIRDMDGNETGRTVVNADMTYTWTPTGGEAVSGTMSFSDEGGPCFLAEGEAEPMCFPPTAAEDVAEDGSWPSHDENGEVNGTVIRVDA